MHFLHSFGEFLNIILSQSVSIKFLQGGMKAVVWTDSIQIMLMYGTLILIIVKGTLNVGGLSVIWNRNVAGGRIHYPE